MMDKIKFVSIPFLGEIALKDKKTFMKMELLAVTVAKFIKRNVGRVLPLTSEKNNLYASSNCGII